MAPFQVSLIAIGLNKSAMVQEATSSLYAELTNAGIEVLFDDRDERMGVMLADQELIGIPVRIVVGERGLKEGLVEVQGRRDASAEKLPLAQALSRVQEKLG